MSGTNTRWSGLRQLGYYVQAAGWGRGSLGLPCFPGWLCRLRRRPMGRIIDPLQQMGVAIAGERTALR